MVAMKSLKEYMDRGYEELIVEADKKLLSSPDEIDSTNPLVKKLLKACAKNGYQLKKAFFRLNSKGKPSGWYTISVIGCGSGYHPEIRYNMNGKSGEMFYLHVDLDGDFKMQDAKAYADGLAKGVAMLEVMNGIDGTKLPAMLNFVV